MSKVYSPFYTAEHCCDVRKGHRSLCYPGLSCSIASLPTPTLPLMKPSHEREVTPKGHEVPFPPQ